MAEMPALLKNNNEVNYVLERAKKGGYKTDNLAEKKQSINVGLKSIKEGALKFALPQPTMNVQNVLDFLTLGSTNKERAAFLELFSTILSSYLFRTLVCKKFVADELLLEKGEYQSFHIEVSDSEGSMQMLKTLCGSSCLNLHINAKHMIIKTPPVIKWKIGQEKRISARAYIKCRGCDFKWPALYRDTTVLIDGRAFRPLDIKKFAELNPWCALIIYGKKVELPYRKKYKIDGRDIATLNINPLMEDLRVSVICFLNLLPQLLSKKNKLGVSWAECQWQDISSMLAKYLNEHRRIKMSAEERIEIKIKLLSLKLFVDVLSNEVDDDIMIDENPFEKIFESAANVFLPGCFSKENEEISVPPQKAGIEIVRELTTPAFLPHFVLINDRGEFCPEYTDKGVKTWGIIKRYRWGNDYDSWNLCMVVFRQGFFDYAEETGRLSCEEIEVILKSLQKNPPAYLHPTPNVRIKRTKEGRVESITALRFSLDKLNIRLYR